MSFETSHGGTTDGGIGVVHAGSTGVHPAASSWRRGKAFPSWNNSTASVSGLFIRPREYASVLEAQFEVVGHRTSFRRSRQAGRSMCCCSATRIPGLSTG